MIVIDVSSSTLGFSNTIAKSLVTLSDDPSQRAGLVLASQSAYVALPPETPGSALRGWARMISYINAQNNKLIIRARLDRTPLPNPAPGDYPWVGVFTGGTKLSDSTFAQCPRTASTKAGGPQTNTAVSSPGSGIAAARCSEPNRPSRSVPARTRV